MRARRFIAIGLAGVAALTAAGAVYQILSVAREVAQFPPPGTLVDVGGRRLHIVCEGNGEPAVIFEGSGFGNSLSFSVARAEIAAARVRDAETRRSLELFARARDLARRNVEVVRESYQLGRNTLFEVFAEQRRLVETETAYVDALARAFEARTSLLRATGARP